MTPIDLATRLRSLITVDADGQTPLAKALAKEWDESAHPRGAGGRFGSGDSTATQSSESSTTERPAVGSFQFSQEECNRIGLAYQKAKDDAVLPNPPPDAVRGIFKEQRQEVWSKMAGEQAVATEMAKILGYDQPAKVEPNPYERMDSERPTLFRGCSQEGVDALTSELSSYNGTGGTLLGPGIYTTDNVRVANEFGKTGGFRVGIWADQEMKVADTSNQHLWKDTAFVDTRGWSKEALTAKSVSESNPTLQALSHGYQALNGHDMTEQNATVVFDRSALTINIENMS